MSIINQDEGLFVPEKTIAVFPTVANNGLKKFDMNFDSFLKPLKNNHKRDWFPLNFYRCLPLAIGNMQGFSFSIPYSFNIFWNGGNSPDDIEIVLDENFNKYKGTNCVGVVSKAGSGVITILFPVQLKTPPGINLMTIAPPNFPTPGVSAMTGVIEADNLRFSFTFNLKIDIPNIWIKVEKDYPVCGLIPIPRYFLDSFELKNAYDIFDKDVVEDEIKVVSEHGERRTKDLLKPDRPLDRLYYKGMDIKGNKFKDHQLPKKIK